MTSFAPMVSSVTKWVPNFLMNSVYSAGVFSLDGNLLTARSKLGDTFQRIK